MTDEHKVLSQEDLESSYRETKVQLDELKGMLLLMQTQIEQRQESIEASKEQEESEVKTIREKHEKQREDDAEQIKRTQEELDRLKPTVTMLANSVMLNEMLMNMHKEMVSKDDVKDAIEGVPAEKRAEILGVLDISEDDEEAAPVLTQAVPQAG